MMSLALLDSPGSPAVSSDVLGLPDLLGGLASLVEGLDRATYNAPPSPGEPTVADRIAAIARRVDALVRASESRVLVYERARNMPRETDAVADARRLERLRERTLALRTFPGDTPIWVVHIVGPLGDVDRGWSTFGAEVAFVVNYARDQEHVIVRRLAHVNDGAARRTAMHPLPPLASRSASAAVAPLLTLLDDLANVIASVPPGIYTAHLNSHVSGTIGQHVRHCLDHVRALVGTERGRTLSYDRRHRGTAVESDPEEARVEIVRLKAAAVRWSACRLDERVKVESLLSPGAAPTLSTSSLARELAFVINHTIHHQALIAVLMTWHGCPVATGFGYAPSTPRPD